MVGEVDVLGVVNSNTDVGLGAVAIDDGGSCVPPGGAVSLLLDLLFGFISTCSSGLENEDDILEVTLDAMRDNGDRMEAIIEDPRAVESVKFALLLVLLILLKLLFSMFIELAPTLSVAL